MKIAMYVPCWPPGLVANGIVTYAAQIIPALRRLGHEVFVVTPITSVENDPYTIHLQRYVRTRSPPKRLLAKIGLIDDRDTPLFCAIEDLVTRKGIDVFEIEESFGMSKNISNTGLLPVVVRLHGPWFMTGGIDRDNALSQSRHVRVKREGAAIVAADFVTAPSLAVVKAVKSHYGIELPQSTVIPNPLDLVPESDRWSLESCHAKSLLCVGRFDIVKGGDLVLKAFSILAEIYPQLILTFVGPDVGIKSSDGRTLGFDEYASRILTRDALRRVTFKGKLSSSEIVALRKQHIAALCASRTEVFGYSVLEAMSSGCPIVAAAVGGIPEIIQSGRNGLLFASNDLESMVAACCKIMDDKTMAARLGSQASLDCGRLYATKPIANRTVSAYRQAIANHALRSRQADKGNI